MCSRTLFAICALLLAVPAQAKVFVTVSEALARAYPKCETRPETRYLTPGQQERAKELAGLPASGALVVRYVAMCGDKPAGHAYTDTHRVRTHPETLMIAVDAQGKVLRVEVLSFEEPLEYVPRPEWYATYQKAPLDAELQIKKRIPFVTGASLTSRATLEAVRRALALEAVLGEGKPAK
jgi:hypothetical protein